MHSVVDVVVVVVVGSGSWASALQEQPGWGYSAMCSASSYSAAGQHIAVLKSRTFSVVNHRMLRGQCDRLRNFLTLYFVIILGRFCHLS